MSSYNIIVPSRRVRSYAFPDTAKYYYSSLYQRKKRLGITLFEAKKYECRAKPVWARLCTDSYWQNFFNFFAMRHFFARCRGERHVPADDEGHPHRALTHSHEALGLFPTPAARLYARMTVSVGVSFLSPFFHHPAAHTIRLHRNGSARRFPPPFSPAPTVKARKKTAAPLPLLFFFCTQKTAPEDRRFYCVVLSEPAGAQRSM